jgi:hypothetical protein
MTAISNTKNILIRWDSKCMQSVVLAEYLLHNGDSRVYIELSENWTKSILFSFLLEIMQVK